LHTHPVRATPFPSTTLFRSGRLELLLIQVLPEAGFPPGPGRAFSLVGGEPLQRFDDRRALLRRGLRLDLEYHPFECHPFERTEADRKSTRLNSSHQIISYAV